MKKSLVFALFCVMLLASSCGAYKRMGYLQDMEPGQTYEVTRYPDPHIYINDKIRIVVTSSTPELAAPFNMVSGAITYDPVSGDTNLSTDVKSEEGYTVDTDGNINFPVLGKIHVDGISPQQLKDLIEGELISRAYINDPIVNVDFINFQITTLGELGASNRLIPSGEINIIQALAEAGDVTENAQRDDIWVVRTLGGTREVFSINLKSRSLYDSPAFWLQQNDLIYVKPRDTTRDAAVNNIWQWVTMTMSFANIASTILLWLSYSKK